MAFENMDDIESDFDEAEPQPEEGGNRVFIIVAAIIGLLILLGVGCLAAVAWPRFQEQQQERANRITESVGETQVAASTQAALETETAIIVLQTAEQAARVFTATPSPTAAGATSTPVLAASPTQTPIFLGSPTPTDLAQARQTTVAAFLTSTAMGGGSGAGVITATALPSTGFADEVGAPTLLALAVLLVGVIFVARRLRTA